MQAKLLLSLCALALLVPPALAISPGPAAGEALPDQIVIGFHDVPADLAWVEAMGGTITLRDDVLKFVAVKFPSGAAAQAALGRAALREDVRYAEPDGIATVQLVPNDPLYGQQWGFPAIFAEQAWDRTLGSTSAKVAILDTGVWGGHPDLAGHICGPHASFVPGEVPLVDGFGHGTHVAGTVAARTNNGVGVAGTSQSCLMDVKVLSRFGGGQWTWVAAGIRYAADNGAHVISMSLGGSANPGSVMADAVKYAYNAKNVLVVAAAGNSGCNVGGLVPPIPGVPVARFANDGTMLWPARFDEVQAVAALAPPDGLTTAGFSSCGADMEIAAPGQAVLSSVPPCTMAWAMCSGSLYGSASGTSMATPHVSGVAALVKSQDPGINAVALRCVLNLAADDLATGDLPLPRDHQTGWGKLNALKALSLSTSVQPNLATFTSACTTGAPVLFN